MAEALERLEAILQPQMSASYVTACVQAELILDILHPSLQEVAQAQIDPLASPDVSAGGYPKNVFKDQR